MGRPRHLLHSVAGIDPIAEEQLPEDPTMSASLPVGPTIAADPTALACAISSEASSVLAVMRRSLRFSSSRSVPGSSSAPVAASDSDALVLDHPLLLSLKSLRRHLFLSPSRGANLSDDPAVILRPFLDAVRSDEAGAAVTSAALSSLHRILTLGFLTLGSTTASTATALREVVDAVTSCRFEAVDAAAEEAVLMRILQVLLACLQADTTASLGDQHVCTAVNTCFRVVHQAGAKGELLQRFSRHAMHELVRCVFARLPMVKGEEDEDEDASCKAEV